MKRRHLRKRIASGARRVGRYVLGTKGTVFEAGGGAAAYYGMRFLTTNFEQLNKHWYLPSIAVAVIGHIAKRKAPKYAQAASAAIGAAGAIGAMAYEMNKQSEANGGETKGFDTGILMLGQGPNIQTNFALDQFHPANIQMPLPTPAAIPAEPVQAAVSEAAALGL